MSKYVPWVKKSILLVLLILESLATLFFIDDFVSRQRFFSLDLVLSIKIISSFLITSYTISVISGTVEKLWERIVLSLVVALVAEYPIAKYRIDYAFVIGIVSFLLIMLSTYRSSSTQKSLIKFSPSGSLKYAPKTLLLIFCLVAALMALFSPSNLQNVNIGEQVADITEGPIRSIIEARYKQELEAITKAEESYNQNLNKPEVQQVLNNLGVSFPSTPVQTPDTVELAVKDTIAQETNKIVEPYKKYLSWTTAVLVFAVFQLYTTAALFLFSPTVGLLFKILGKLRFLKVEKVITEKEVLKL